jgi:cell division protein FtsB
MDFHPNNQHLSSFYRSNTSTPPKSFTHQLDPNSIPFQPTEMEMQRYQQLPPTPPSSYPTSADEMMQMRNYLLSSHFAHTKDMVGLQRAFEREAQSNLHEIETIKSTVKKDLQTLQAQIEDLKAHASTKNDNEKVITQQSHDSYSISHPTEEGPNFSGLGLAEIYLEEANTLEATAASLRRQAAQLSDGESVVQPNMMKLLEGARDLDNMSKIKSKTEFACCGIKYKSANELLEHVRGVHGCDSQRISISEGDATPTHVPACRSKPVAEYDIKQEPELNPEDQTTRGSMHRRTMDAFGSSPNVHSPEARI